MDFAISALCTDNCVAVNRGTYGGRLGCMLGGSEIPAHHCELMTKPDFSCDNPTCQAKWVVSDWSKVRLSARIIPARSPAEAQATNIGSKNVSGRIPVNLPDRLATMPKSRRRQQSAHVALNHAKHCASIYPNNVRSFGIGVFSMLLNTTVAKPVGTMHFKRANLAPEVPLL
ncbi:unnamed protein product [Mesocestoides corti]|uniref:Uncharacterized protein n=1 Tax=Mesocestoides corti TaxID=53468 RepID=A0A0R3UMD8_MESCO|nr:unnamed protein product [Mesocestoides corti]